MNSLLNYSQSNEAQLKCTYLFKEMIMVLDNETKFGTVSKVFHWLSAIVILALFAVGFWMVDLNYYSEWYRTAPYWHKSIGILLLGFTLARLLWKFITPSPKALTTHTKLTLLATKLGHLALYSMLLVILISGYLISTADGRAIEVFTWFEVVSLGELIANQEDVAGRIHKYAAYSLMAIVVIHILAALKHHFIDKDATLRRMIK